MADAPEAHDEALLRQVADGSDAAARQALEMLYDRHATAVMDLARRLGADGPTAEDVLQDVFVIVAGHARDFRGSSARSWLLAVAGNRVRELARQRRRRAGRERSAASSAVDHTVADPSADQKDELARLLSALPAPRRAAVELRVAQGLAFHDVAQVLGVSLRTAKAWVEDGLSRLRGARGGDR